MHLPSSFSFPFSVGTLTANSQVGPPFSSPLKDSRGSCKHLAKATCEAAEEAKHEHVDKALFRLIGS